MKISILFFPVYLFFFGFTLAQTNKNIEPVAIFKKQEGAILSVAFQPDGRVIATGSDDKTCLLRSFPDGKEIYTITGFTNGVKVCSYTSDLKYLLAASERNIRIYTPSGEFVRMLGGSATHIWSFSFNPAVNKVVFGSYDKSIRIADFNTGKFKTITGHSKNALAVRYSPDNKLFATGSLDETVKVWSAVDDSLLFTLTGHGGNIYDVLFTPDSKKIISASGDNTIRVWDIEARKWERSLLGNESAVFCVAISPDGSYLVSGLFDGTVKLWDMNRGECVFSVMGHTGQVNAVAFSPDGKFFITGGADKQTLVWELKPEYFVEKYFSAQFKEELEKSGLFAPKAKDESKDVYKIRQQKASLFEYETINKYYQRYLSEIKGKIEK